MRAQKASVFVEIAVEERLVDFYAVFFVRSSRTFVGGFVQNLIKQAQICDLVHLDTCADTGISGKIFLMKKNRL